MRRAHFIVSLLGLQVSCAASPSSVPLGGGSEWSLAEQHVTRRHPQAARDAKELASKPAPSAGTLTSSAPSSPVPPPAVGPTGEVALGLASLKQDDTIDLRIRMSLRARLATGADKPEGRDVHAESSKHLSVRIVEAGADGVRAANVHYRQARSQWLAGADPAKAAVEGGGRRYRVNFSGATPRVSILTGASGPDEEHEVLFDLATVTGYVPLAKRLLPLTLPIGWSARLPADTLKSAFGAAEGVRFEDAMLTLRGRDPAHPELALFDCNLPVHLAHEGLAFSASLSGTCVLRAAEGRPVRVRLQGPVLPEGGTSGAGAPTAVGTLQVELDQSYGR